MKNKLSIISLILALITLISVLPIEALAYGTSTIKDNTSEKFIIGAKTFNINDFKTFTFDCYCNIPVGFGDLADPNYSHYCCFNQAQQFYKKVWGTYQYNDKNLLSSRVALSVSNLKKCLTQAPNGSFVYCVRSWQDGVGHAMVLLKSDNNGAWFFNGNGDAKGGSFVRYYSWNDVYKQFHYSGADQIRDIIVPRNMNCNINLDYKPATPAATATTSDIPVGGSVTINWNAVQGATSYTVNLSDGQTATVSGTSASFKINGAGTYSAVVYAKNNSYTSNASSSVTVRVHNPSTVSFYDYDNTLISSQTVAYGKSATAPSSPTRTGYTFTGWDTVYTSVKSNLTVKATYKINTYTVKFFDKSGQQIGISQTVNYGDDATPPENTNIPTGYEFVGWSNQNYLNVGSDGAENGSIYRVDGIYAWGNEDLPIVANITSASRQSDGYYVYIDLTNYPNAITRGRAVVSLKTSEGKLIDTTESSAFSIPKDSTKRGIEVFVPCEKAASVAEVIVVDSYTSGVPISKSVTSSIDQAAMWSDWSTENPSSEDATVEERTEYRYRDKQYTTASTSSLAGWTLYDTSVNYGSWSSWSTSAVSSTSTRDVETKWVATQYKTQYVYKRYKYWNAEAGAYYYSYGSSWATSMGYSGSWQYNILDYQLEYRTSYDGVPNYAGNWFRGDCSNQGSYTTFTISTPVVNAHTEYRYRNNTYTYKFYKWNDTWSSWSPSSVSATNDRQVETRTTYRSKSISAATEDTSGISRTVSGTVDSSFAGKELTLYVYKVTEASDWTNEFIAQTNIGSDGSYSFTFKLREEPTIETGDYTVAIGIEGTTNLITIDTIEAPKPTYTVKFYDKSGSVISTQSVTEGENANAPELADVEGYAFTCWNTSFVNVHDDLDITPVYVPLQYAVVAIDEHHDTVEVKNFDYGDLVVLDAPEEIEGYDFIGWDALIDGEVYITDNMIVNAVYEKKEFEVTFFNYDEEVLEVQTVEYGDKPVVPKMNEDGTHVFDYWLNENQSADGDPFCITDTTFYTPVFEYEETVENPVASVKSGKYHDSQLVELTCDTPDSLIYYTLDGSDPKTSKTAKLYTSSIIIFEKAELKFYACAYQMNDSEITSEYYITERSPWMLYEEMPDYAVSSPSAFDVSMSYGYRYIESTVTTSSIEEAAGLEERGWVEDTEAYEYSEFTDWAIRDSIDSDLIDVTVEKNIENGVEYSRYKTGIKTYNLYIISTVRPDVECTETFMYSFNYPVRHFVTVNGNGNTNTFIVDNNSLITENIASGKEGYHFAGFYLDSDFNQPWSISDDKVLTDVVLYEKYIINEYQVMFYDIEDRIIDVQTVEHGACATEPDNMEKEGYIFLGWDTSFESVTESISIKPRYVSEEDYAKVELDYSEYTLVSGSSFKLNATVTPENKAESETVTWASSNYSVATVDNDGNVTALKSGVAEITATVSGSNFYDICTLTVTANSSLEFVVREESSLLIDSYRQLRGLKDKDNSVDSVLAQLKNSNVTVKSSAGKTLTGDALIGTGAVFTLYNGGVAKDTVTAILTGDMTQDGKVNTKDVSMLMRYLVDKETPSSYQLAAMDVNGDGLVNNRDAAMVARYLVGKESLQ